MSFMKGHVVKVEFNPILAVKKQIMEEKIDTLKM